MLVKALRAQMVCDIHVSVCVLSNGMLRSCLFQCCVSREAVPARGAFYRYGTSMLHLLCPCAFVKMVCAEMHRLHLFRVSGKVVYAQGVGCCAGQASCISCPRTDLIL